MPTDLILASGSPRRRELLMTAGYHLEIIVPDDHVEAEISPDLPAEEFVAVASARKAQWVAQSLDSGVIIGADTVAVCQGQTLGKPRDQKHAREMLLAMSGQRHHVLTGVTLWSRPTDQHLTHVESTELEMDDLSLESIDAYVATGAWEGKAGAFGYQDGLDWVHIVTGLESNVVGLPVELLPDLIHQLHTR